MPKRKLNKDIVLGGIGKALGRGEEALSTPAPAGGMMISKADFPNMGDVKEGDVITITASVDSVVDNDISFTITDVVSTTPVTPSVEGGEAGVVGSKLAGRLTPPTA